MAKVKEISVGTMFTKNLGNYESLKIDAGVTLSVEPGDNVEELYDKAYAMVGDQVANQLKLFENQRGLKRGL